MVKAERFEYVEYSVVLSAITNDGPVPMELGITSKTKDFGSSSHAVVVSNTQQKNS